MDIVTQAVLGAAASQAVFARRLPRSAWLIGALAGLLADADVLIPAGADPLGGLTWHRHFSHSLVFIPIGALIAAMPFLLLPAWRGSRGAVYLAALVAYATHGLLDACTSYGTLLLWPFSNERIAWDFIAIIDPAFTVPLLVGVIAAAWLRRPGAARAALVLAVAYMAFGWVQRDRVMEVQRELAAMRGHTIERGRVVPAPLSLMLWRSVYLDTQGQLHADAVRVPYFDGAAVQPGASARRVTLEDVKHELNEPALVRAFAEYEWFADGFLALQADDPRVVGDMRYCLEPQSMESLWGFSLGEPAAPVMAGVNVNPRLQGADVPQPRRLVRFSMSRGRRLARVWSSLVGENPAFQSMSALRLRVE